MKVQGADTRACYICGHQVCTACGFRDFYAWPSDADVSALQCYECGEMASRPEGAAWPLTLMPAQFAVTTINNLLASRLTRPLLH